METCLQPEVSCCLMTIIRKRKNDIGEIEKYHQNNVDKNVNIFKKKKKKKKIFRNSINIINLFYLFKLIIWNIYIYIYIYTHTHTQRYT